MIGFIFAAIACVTCVSCSATHSFMPIRPPFQSGSPERLALTHDQLKWFDIEERSTFQICSFGGVSTNANNIAAYFLPYNKTELKVGEFGSTFVQEGDVDVIANYFGIYTAPAPVATASIEPTLSTYTFQSKLTFKPKHSFAGLGFVYHYHISPCLNKGFWLEVSTPLMYVRNTMGMCEHIITPGGPNGDDPEVPAGYVGTMTQAFKQNKFLWGRIDGARTAWGLADIELKVGYTYGTGCNYHLDSYWGLHIPTGKKPLSEYLFEPIIGQTQNFGIFGGTVAGFKIWSGSRGWVSFELETVGKLFLGNSQIRMLDLQDKAWGRYLWVYTNNGTSQLPSPGINIFSQLCDVQPGSTRDLNTAFVFGNGWLQIEAGYHFFSRESETLSFDKQWAIQPAVAAIWQDSTDTFIQGGLSRNGATMNNYAGINNDVINGTETYVPLKLEQLNLESGAGQADVLHTIYATIGYQGSISHYPTGFNIGGSYEFGKKFASVDRILVWAKMDIGW